MRKTTPEQFWSKVDKSGECWVWLGYKDKDGYGGCKLNGRTARAHRAALVYSGTPVPDHLFVLHCCDNTSCVRPDHLRLGTHADNMRDKVVRHRSASGERNGRAKITADAAREICKRVRSGEVQAVVGQDFGIHQGQVSRIVQGRQWRVMA